MRKDWFKKELSKNLGARQQWDWAKNYFPMTRIEVGVRDLVWRIGDDQAQVEKSVAKRSGGRVMLCVIRIVHVKEMRSACFLV
jgi:hypothetical protein